MLVSRVETLWPSSIGPAPFFFVLVHCDDGRVGVGQTADPRRTVPAVLEWAERFLIGENPIDRERFWRRAFAHASLHGYAGAEMRAISALDIALWDLAGQAAGMPVHDLLGGRMRDEVPIYNTCSHYGDHNDRTLVRSDPVRLADELLSAGIGAMKFSPLDHLAGTTGSGRLDERALADALAPIRTIRERFGTEMEVAIEAHGRWNLPNARRIARHAADLGALWLEDVMRPDHPEGLAELRAETGVVLGGSEHLQSCAQFQPFLDAGATDVVIADVSWCGGISELWRLANLADLHRRPIAPHDHTGPVAFAATGHVMIAAPNALLMEATRAFYETYYAELVKPAPVIAGGCYRPSGEPGLGLRLRDDVRNRADLVRHETSKATILTAVESRVPSSVSEPA